MRAPQAAVLLAALLLLGCTVGPAANRAERAGTSPPDVSEPEREPETRTSSTPDGPVEVVEAMDISGAGLDEPCCLAELPDGDLLVGAHDTGMVHRLDRNGGAVTEVGAVWEVTLGADHVLLALAAAPGWLYASYADTNEITIARHPYDPAEPPGEQLGIYPHAFIREIPKADGAALAFGPDGMLYAGTSDGGRPELASDPGSPAGKILRMTPTGEVPEDNPVPGSFVYSLGHADVRGLAWDAAGQLWVADAASGMVSAVVPGRPTTSLWHAPGAGSRVSGLAYGAGCLWLATSATLWRVPLDGAAPVPFDGDIRLSGTRAVLPGVWVLAGEWLLRLGTSG